ncbi:MAG: OmpA family protein [Candidatus Kapabacteria bacterium]|nr:OmpA family protein [Candidatus Kapabacteria bacterium]
MNLRWFSLLCIVGVLWGNTNAVAQSQSSPLQVGVLGGLNFNFHQPSITTPDARTAYQYTTSALGLGGAFGLGFNYPLSTDIGLGIRLGYNNLSGDIKSNTKQSVDTIANRTLKSSLSALEFTPMLYFPNLITNNLYAMAGLELGIPIAMTASSSTDSTIAGFTRSSSTASADIPDAPLRIGLAIGAGYDIALGESGATHLQPEISFRLPFSKVSSNTAFSTWTVPQLRVGVNLFFDLAQSENPKRDTNNYSPYAEPTIKRVLAFNDKGDSIDVRTVKVEDIQYSELYPLVPYIFFTSNGKKVDSMLVIPQKKESGEATDITTLNDAVKVNYTILDIVCTRMKKYEQAKLTVIGTNDGKTEAKNKALAKERAEQVRDYLVNCGVATDRITVVARDLPEKASSSNVPEGIAENRRVELRSETPEILEPVVSRLELERIADPDVLEFIPEVRTSDPIINWKLELQQAGRTLREIPGLGDAKPVRWAIRPGELSDKQVQIDYAYTVENARGATKTYNGSIPVDYISSIRKKQEKLADRTVNKFSLILFDFDSDVLTPENQRILEQKVQSAIKYNSVVKIQGYTDRIGDDKYNKTLSERRAKSVMNALKAKYPDVRFETVGFGETKQNFDNEVPIGRQLNRTVQIIVETPR